MDEFRGVALSRIHGYEDAECGRPCHLRNGRARGRCLIHHRSRGARRAGSLHASHLIQEIGNKVIGPASKVSADLGDMVRATL